MRFQALLSPDDAGWDAFAAIYEEAFPRREREPPAMIARRVAEGRYVLEVGTVDVVVAGFHLTEVDRAPGYAFLMFLAVRADLRGRGLGAALCRRAMSRFTEQDSTDWLFVEGEERQARFYGRLGFRRVAIDYEAPHYGAQASTAMRLLVLPRDGDAWSIPAARLRETVDSIFRGGYFLEPDDPRLARQLARIGDAEEIALEPWPPREEAAP